MILGGVIVDFWLGARKSAFGMAMAGSHLSSWENVVLAFFEKKPQSSTWMVMGLCVLICTIVYLNRKPIDKTGL